MMRKPLLLLVLLALSSPAVASSTHVNINAVGGTPQTIPIGQQLPQPFIARVTFDDGSPVVGVDLAFSVNTCASVPELPVGSCPAPSVYGYFLGTAVATTDVSGNAIAPPFVAGTTQGAYSVFVTRANWSQLINGQTLTDIPASSPASNLFHVVQTATGATDPTPTLPAAVADPAPTLPFPATLVLIALLGLAAYFRQRPI